MRRTQTNIFDYFDQKELKRRYGRTQYGGLSTKGHRKLERPLSTKHSIHLVLKSDKATGRYGFLLPKNKRIVDQILRQKARKFGIKIGDFANVGNHLHLKLRISSRGNFQKFLKSVTCLIARKITGARKGRPFGRFWQGLAFTRVLKSWTEELNLRGYLIANRLEAHRPEARAAFLRRFNHWVYVQRNSGA